MIMQQNFRTATAAIHTRHINVARFSLGISRLSFGDTSSQLAAAALLFVFFSDNTFVRFSIVPVFMRLCLWQLGVFVLFVRQVYSTLCIEHTLHSRSPPSSALVPCGSQEQQLSKRFDSINDPITFDFTCRSASQDECAKVNNTLIKAGQILASVIRLNNAIRVNASYLPFCQDLNDCDTANGALNVGRYSERYASFDWRSV